MRMWMVDPSILCQQHLLGEHVECHMFLGHLRKGRRVDGYIDNDLFEPLSLEERHNELAEEMERRGMHHQSPLKVKNELEYLPASQRAHVVNSFNSRAELLRRCPECKRRGNHGNHSS